MHHYDMVSRLVILSAFIPPLATAGWRPTVHSAECLKLTKLVLKWPVLETVARRNQATCNLDQLT